MDPFFVDSAQAEDFLQEVHSKILGHWVPLDDEVLLRDELENQVLSRLVGIVQGQEGSSNLVGVFKELLNQFAHHCHLIGFHKLAILNLELHLSL